MIHIRHLAGLALMVLWLGGCVGLSEPADSVQETAAPGVATEESDRTNRVESDERREQTVEETAQDPQTERPRGLTREILYSLLVADLANRQGDLETALQGYMASAHASRDPRVAKRATRVALYAGREELALEMARRWLELAPNQNEAHTIAARLYLRQGESGRAVTHLRRVIELAEGGVDAGLHEVSALTTRSSHSEAALDAMEQLRQSHGSHSVVHYAIGDLSASLNRSRAALSALDRALEIDPGYSEARVLRARIRMRAGDEAAALDDLRSARARFPDDRDLALGTARLLVKTERPDAARTIIREAFEQFGDDSLAVYSLALLAMQIGAWDDARIHLQRLLEMEQRTSSAHYYLGRIAHQQADCTTALRHYIKVGRGDHRFDAGLQAAECMAELGRVDEARLHLDRMRRRYDQTEARLRIVATRARIEHIAGDPARALSVLNEAVDRFPDQLDLRYSRALTAAEQDRFELARSDLEVILQEQPDNARALNALGYMLANRNRELDRARDMIKRALAQNPDDPATIDSMGWVLYRQGEYEQALEHLRNAWQLDPDPEIAAHLGEVLWVLDRQEEARTIWDEARELSPESRVLRETVERLTR